jgi:hypothetical protein
MYSNESWTDSITWRVLTYQDVFKVSYVDNGFHSSKLEVEWYRYMTSAITCSEDFVDGYMEYFMVFYINWSYIVQYWLMAENSYIMAQNQKR